jgi:uncharacterized protein YggE
MGRTVTVTGRGRASGTFDEATLNLAASARAANPTDATARATYAIAAMREAMVARGVEPGDLATTHVSLNPVHDPWPTVVAYEASLSMRVRLSDLERVGSLLVAAVEAGGDGARIEGISFGHRDPSGLARAARDDAFDDARSKAEQFAALSGLVLGEVRTIVDGEAAMAPMPRMRMMAAAAADPGGPPIDAGEGVVSAGVTVTWSLARAAAVRDAEPDVDPHD